MRVDLWMVIGVSMCGMLALSAPAAGQTVRPCECNRDCVIEPGAVCVPAPDVPFEGKCCPGSWKCPDATGSGQSCDDGADTGDVGSVRDAAGDDAGEVGTFDAAGDDAGEDERNRDAHAASGADAAEGATGRDGASGGATWRERGGRDPICGCRAPRETPPPLAGLLALAAALVVSRARRRAA